MKKRRLSTTTLVIVFAAMAVIYFALSYRREHSLLIGLLYALFSLPSTALFIGLLGGFGGGKNDSDNSVKR